MIICLIPARSGSKRIKDKNIRPLGGYPLMAWSIVAAKMLPRMDIYVSSESEEYLKIAQYYGAIPHLRSKEAASDTAKDKDVIDDFRAKSKCGLKIAQYYGVLPRFRIMFLRPTTPLREPFILAQMLDLSSDFHWVSLAKMRDGDFYRNTGYCEIFSSTLFNKNKAGYILETEVGEIDTEEDFDFIEWRLKKYGSPIYDYLRRCYPYPESV